MSMVLLKVKCLFLSKKVIDAKLINVSGTSSKEAHAKQKVEKQERKAAKPNADSIARSKKIWERLRIKSRIDKEEKKDLVAELFGILTGHIKEYVFKHDSVRVIQTALKYAVPDQRALIMEELRGEYRALAESKYAKFLVGKILVHGRDDARDKIVPEFYGHVRRLIKHSEASWILDDIYRGIATRSQKATLLKEWYGAEFALLSTKEKEPATANLKDILSQRPEKRTPIMRSLLDLINLLVQKKTTGFTMLHDAMLQYFLNVQHGSEEMTNFVELIKGDEEGDLLKNLAFTKSGAHLVSLVLAHGNAKDRKHIIRTYKDAIGMLANDKHGHQVLTTIYDCVDDTVLVSKSVISELVGKEPRSTEQEQGLIAAAADLNSRIPLLYPFCGLNKAILPDSDRELILEVSSIRTDHATSKKDPGIRHKELANSLSPPLLSLIASNAQTLIGTSFGCQFMTEVLLDSSGDREPALVQLAKLAMGTAEEQALLETAHAARLLKTLVQGGRFSKLEGRVVPSSPPLGFEDKLYEAIRNDAIRWATGNNSFVILGLLEAPGFSFGEALRGDLRKNREELKLAADETAISASKKKKLSAAEKKSKVPEKAKKGNRGTQLLLQQL